MTIVPHVVADASLEFVLLFGVRADPMDSEAVDFRASSTASALKT